MSSTPHRRNVSGRSGSSAHGNVPLNASANAFSPRDTHRGPHQRENSEQDSTSSVIEHGTIGRPGAHRSHTFSTTSTGGVAIYSTSGYGQGASHAASSSELPSHRVRSQSTPTMMGPVASSQAAAVQALIVTGPVVVFITAERERPNADPNRPAFLKGVVFDPNNQDEWYKTVLPYVRELTFSIDCTPDVHFGSTIFGSQWLPRLYNNVTKLQFPGFYWFSGIQYNRLHNPCFQLATHLPFLREISITMQTAGVTTSAFSERRMCEIARDDQVRAKERRVMRLPDVVAKYELNALFGCGRHLSRIRIEYIECEMTAHFTKIGNPANVLRAVQVWLVQEFAEQGRNVGVELIRVD